MATPVLWPLGGYTVMVGRLTCVDAPVRSPEFNVRCHVLPQRWFSFLVLNTGGKALEDSAPRWVRQGGEGGADGVGRKCARHGYLTTW